MWGYLRLKVLVTFRVVGSFRVEVEIRVCFIVGYQFRITGRAWVFAKDKF